MINLKKKTYLFFLSTIFCKFIYNLLIYVTIKSSAFHFLIIVIISQLSPYILNLFNIDNNISNNILIIIIIGLFFILFMTLVFNEVFELNFFGLQKYTKKNIINRAKQEEKNIHKNIDNNNNNDKDINNDINNENNESVLSDKSYLINLEMKKDNENNENNENNKNNENNENIHLEEKNSVL